MTWLGKILLFLVLLGCLAWGYFTVQVYVTRVNWKYELERYKAASKEESKKWEEESLRHLAKEDALVRLLALERQKTTDLTKERDTLSANAKKTTEDFQKLQEEYNKGDVQAKLLATNLERAHNEVADVRKRSNELENERVALIIDREKAKVEQTRAENAAKLALGIAEDNARKIEELQVRITELKASGGSAQATVLKSLDKAPPPVLDNLHGEVERVAGDLVQISIGLDAGVSKGTVLNIVRLDNGGQYLGTIRVTDVYPKQAIAVFTPARANVPFNQLRPEELPKKRDEVRPPDGR